MICCVQNPFLFNFLDGHLIEYNTTLTLRLDYTTILYLTCTEFSQQIK